MLEIFILLCGLVFFIGVTYLIFEVLLKKDEPVLNVPPLLKENVTNKWKETLPKQNTRIKNRNKRKRK